MDPDAPSSSSDLILRNRRIVRRSSASKYAKSPADNCARSSFPEIPAVVSRSPELSRQDALKLRQGLTSVNLSAEMKRKKFPGSSSNSPSTPCPNKLGYHDCCRHLPGAEILRHWLATPSSSQSSSSSSGGHANLQDIADDNNQSDLDLIFDTSGDNPPDAVLADLVDYVNENGDVNITTTSDDKNMLHLAIERLETLQDTLQVMSYLSTLPIKINHVDLNGDTALTLIGQKISKTENSEMFFICQIVANLLRMGANIHHRNNKGMCLLSYNLKHLDYSIELTRMLLNNGADMLRDRESSQNYPLAVFIRKIIEQGSLDNTERSIHLLGSVLSAKGTRTAYDHLESGILSTLLAEAKYPRSNVPNLIIELKEKFEYYWSEPASLQNISIHTIREALANNLNPDRKIFIDNQIDNLLLPVKLTNYLNLYNFSTCDTQSPVNYLPIPVPVGQYTPADGQPSSAGVPQPNHQNIYLQPTEVKAIRNQKPVFHFKTCDLPAAARRPLAARRRARAAVSAAANKPKTDVQEAKEEFVSLTLQHILQTSLKSL